MYKHLHHQPMTADELDELVQRIRDGDVMSMKYLVANNLKLILMFIGGSGDIQADVLHDIVPYIMKSVEKYDSSKGSFSGYMKGAVKWGKWQRYGAWKLGKEREEIVKEELKCTRIYYRESPSPEKLYMRKEYRATRHKALAEALQSLSIRQRWMVQQHYIKGRLLREVAEEDGCTHQNVKQVCDTAIKNMRKHVEKYKQDLR